MNDEIMRVLLVNWDRDNTVLLTQQIIQAQWSEWQISQVSTATEAIMHLATHETDVLLVYLRQANGTLWESFERIHAAYPQIPIVVSTPEDHEMPAGDALQRGATDYLTAHELQSACLVRALRYAAARGRSEQLRQQNRQQQTTLMSIQDTLRETEEKYRTLLNILPIGFSIRRTDGTLLEANAAAEQLFGPISQSSEHVYPDTWQAIHADGSPLLAEEFTSARALREQCMITDENIGVVKDDGTVMWLSVSAAPIPLEGYGVATTYFDITERKRIEQELMVARDQALEATRLKSLFLTNMSHELHTPMNGVMGTTALLLQTLLTPEQRSHIETICTSSEALLSLINDILDYCKIEAGQIVLDSQPFALRGCVHQAVESLSKQAEAKHLSLVMHIDPKVPETILGDATRVRQVLINLVGNALKFTEEGEVRVSVQSTQDTSGLVQVLFSITDTGIGIPADKLGEIFRSFSQIDPSAKQRYGGTGLGLAISRRLAELMGGTIWVESKPGEGSAFHFTIQGKRVITATRQITYMPDKPDRTLGERLPLRILLAEDNAINQKLARMMLKQLGYQVDIASNGLEVIEALHGKLYDLIFMDVQMPEMDGLETARQIRAEWPTESRPHIVALTAHAMQGDREACLAAGMDDYVSKPVRIADLYEALERCGQRVTNHK